MVWVGFGFLTNYIILSALLCYFTNRRGVVYSWVLLSQVLLLAYLLRLVVCTLVAYTVWKNKREVYGFL